VLAEPVLVCISGEWYPREIYDQHGSLLAFGKHQQTGRHSRLRKLLGSEGVDLLDIHGQTQLGLSAERRWTPRLFKATASDGNEIGAVVATGEGRGSLLAGGATVGRLEPSPALFGRNRGRYNLYDMGSVEVGCITHRTTSFGFTTYHVIEIDHRASETIRALVLAASAAVNYWKEPKSVG
jgi:hypothetical protein